MFDFKFSKFRLFSDIIFLLVYSLIIILQLSFELVTGKIAVCCVGAIFCLTFCGSLLFDVDFKAEKIKPTVRTAGLFVLMIFYLCMGFKY